ncbi:helix-turn-helix transcriptional regulator [Pontixanthobacter aestiaquae]|uniref:Helix-turn-helix domain-containing protein n=1 Tax=Pontixanthobacter aestiaquae TaxID=1509367 RepID=A0A844Z8S7_9SPHN|nr:helix-turn-helix transcriptional regulator [Pontixanthobacter aestiaquae]MDN3645775.1 helix-turn-helix transcriptional regulator [Pontixanthobacter aestiaquae]MXO83230.1 helix-turn-helix domain-containing protein [Pontixanthobacter aestiaquae]
MAKGFHDERYRKLIGQLVDRRKKLGWSQRELAEKIGHHQQHVSRYEIGERRLDFVEFADVAAALELEASTLIDSVRR